jgi:shikimate dehydrogenase
MGIITGTTKLLGVVGYPVEHSLSPVMHNAALAKLCQAQSQAGLAYVYLPLSVRPADLATAIAGFAAMGLQGFNVTIPHKQAILPLLTDVSAIAHAVGAVNTVWRTDQGWSGTNTDVQGFLAPLHSYERNWSETEVAILGSGGAARAVIAGCAELGCVNLRVIGRDILKLKQFHQSWSHSALFKNLQVHPWEELPDLLPQIGLLVNSTPVGMHPQINQSLLSPAEMAQLPKSAIVYDLIYTPYPTVLLQQAQAQGLIAIAGLEMLVQQGAAALELWLKQPVPVDTMRQAVRQHLGLRD